MAFDFGMKMEDNDSGGKDYRQPPAITLNNESKGRLSQASPAPASHRDGGIGIPAHITYTTTDDFAYLQEHGIERDGVMR